MENEMDKYEKLTTLARRYCIEQARYWREKYFIERSGLDQYTPQDYDLFPRYNSLDAILCGVEILVGDKYSNYSECVDRLLNATGFKTVFIKKPVNAIEESAINDEMQKYKSYILSFDEKKIENTFVDTLPYRRKLKQVESAEIRKALHEKWNFDGSYWFPLVDVRPISALFLMKKYVEPYEKPIIDIVRSISSNMIYLIEETGNDYEMAIECFGLTYYECICCDKNLDWIVYESHEETIAFAGEKLIPKIKDLLIKYENKFNVFEHWDGRVTKLP